MITRKTLQNCWVIETSTEWDNVIEIKKYIDVEATIQGFDKDDMKEYATKYLGTSL